MPTPHEQQLIGLDSLGAATTLLQRIRNAHPTKGLYEAADLQWWCRNPRSTDTYPQLFWFDDDGRPLAAVIAIDWGDGASAAYDETSLAPLVMPDATPEWIAHVIERGLAHAAGSGIGHVELEVDRDDELTRRLLFERGFAVKEEGLIEAWIAAAARPKVGQLADGYRLFTRADTRSRPHHMINPERNHIDVEPRLRQTSLYRPDLDLVVFDRRDDVAAYGLFWYDPETGTGLVEPMRTESEHQRQGLARHVLTAGIELLAAAGAERIKICYEPGNPASSHLYVSVGFGPVKQTDVLAGRASWDGM